ncbi:hypothetical protein L6164_007485 [Bauhinia variegata]|uniref:Uncharacterized protein n=1 Tax=Bauhinia variegata TaxID=167791 RepID=A0ACB9PDM6_BAUVA|nr:hypothetical protein L6164_007485 [Bauhinia variegata]
MFRGMHELVHGMRKKGIRPKKLTFPFLLKACAMVTALKRREASSGRERAFDERTIVSWNSVITACVENLWFADAIKYFVKMRDCGFEPDEATMVVLLSACAELGNLSLWRWVHSQLIVRGMVLNCQLGSTLVDMYSKSGAVQYARLVFHRLEKRNVWTWSAMILGLAQHGFS